MTEDTASQDMVELAIASAKRTRYPGRSMAVDTEEVWQEEKERNLAQLNSVLEKLKLVCVKTKRTAK